MANSKNRYILISEIKCLVNKIETLASSFINLHQNKYDIEQINVLLTSCFHNIVPVESNIIKSNLIYGTNYSFDFKNFNFSLNIFNTPKLNKISISPNGELIFTSVPEPFYKNLFFNNFFTKKTNGKTSSPTLKYKSSLLNTANLFLYSFHNLFILKKDLEELNHYLQLAHSLFFLFDLIEGKHNLESLASKNLFNSILNNPTDFKIPFWALTLHSYNSQSIASILEYAFKINPLFLDNLSLDYLELIINFFEKKPSILKQNTSLFLNIVQKIKLYKDVKKSLNSSIKYTCTRIKSKKIQKI